MTFGGIPAEVDLSDYVKKDEVAQYIPEQPVAGDDKKHVFLTQDEYNALQEYEDNTIYFVLEGSGGNTNRGWRFGGTFPITFGNIWRFEDPFPITLN